MSSPETCWICGQPANSREHRSKKTDLLSHFGAPSQARPIFLHTDRSRNRHVGSLDADKLKWERPICSDCNNARTQPYDMAWEGLSMALRTRSPRIRPGMTVRTSRIFGADTRAKMLDVHLYFAKQFGCYLAEVDADKELPGFARALTSRAAHPNLYLKFACNTSPDESDLISGSNLKAVRRYGTDELRFATWVYQVGILEVMVMYAAEGEDRQGLIGAWHPRHSTTRLLLSNLAK